MGDGPVEHSKKRAYHNPDTDKVTTTLKVRLADSPRAAYLVLIDRFTDERQRFEWPPSDDGTLVPWKSGLSDAGAGDFADGSVRVMGRPRRTPAPRKTAASDVLSARDRAVRSSDHASKGHLMATRTLAGKTLFITGASRGIGLSIALRAARDGANIVIAAKTTEPHPKLPGTIYTGRQGNRGRRRQGAPLHRRHPRRGPDRRRRGQGRGDLWRD